MRINADFSQTVILRPEDREWVTSPEAGVDRQYLDRIGDEVARATTLVRYIPGSVFKPHVHEMGEEFLVLEGVFADEHGRYPAGTYIRNPPGTTHRPDVPDGCTILVKLRQFDPDDLTPVTRNTIADAGWRDLGNGVESLFLHQYGAENVRMIRLTANAEFQTSAIGGAELFVTEGNARVGDKALPENSWARFPESLSPTIQAGDLGAVIWLKTGHLEAGSA